MLKNGKPTAFSGSVARPAVLVLAPTRELACQIEEEAVKFGQPLGLRSVCVYGGAPKSGQLRLLRGGIDIIVGTPGRLQDFLNMGVISLSGTRFLVLDEADRMLDMGFEQDLRAIVDTLPTTRQTLFFTATWPKAVEKLAAEFAPKPVRMSVGSTDTLSANINITQHIHIVSGEHAKTDKLRALLTQLFIVDSKVQKGHGKCIVFCKFKNACNKIAEEIYNAGFSVNTLHGDMDQYERTQVIGQFRTGELRVLVATDVAARGLDVKDVSDVVSSEWSEPAMVIWF
jgi:ATP-dependent RNA helicase DDX5/DBP2